MWYYFVGFLGASGVLGYSRKKSAPRDPQNGLRSNFVLTQMFIFPLLKIFQPQMWDKVMIIIKNVMCWNKTQRCDDLKRSTRLLQPLLNCQIPTQSGCYLTIWFVASTSFRSIKTEVDASGGKCSTRAKNYFRSVFFIRSWFFSKIPTGGGYFLNVISCYTVESILFFF